MAEAGIIAPDAQVELLDGIIIDMSPIGPFHAGIGIRLQKILSGKDDERWMLRVQYPVRLSGGSEPIPDLTLVKPDPDDYTHRHPSAEDVFLLVEVADSSVRFDREKKLPIYARAGIAEFWIVNLVDRTVEVYRSPSPDGRYISVSRAGLDGVISLEAFPDVQVPVNKLFSSR